MTVEFLVGTEARLLHQLLRRRLVVLDLEGRIAAPGMARLEGAGRRHHQTGEQAVLQAFAIDAEIGRLADANVVPGRAFDARELPRPDMRLLVGVDDEAALLDFCDRIRRRRLDPVDLAGKQRRGAGVRLGHRQQQHLVDLGNARLVPVIFVLHEFEPLARREARHLPGAGARGVLARTRPRRPSISPWRRRLPRHHKTSAISPGSP